MADIIERLRIESRREPHEPIWRDAIDELEALRELCGMAYQLAGVHDAPEKWLDALSNAAAGRPFSTDGLLPYMPQAVCDAEAEAKALREEVTFERSLNTDAIHACAMANIRAERLTEALEGLITWIPSADTYRRLGFDPAAPMRALEEARAALSKENRND